MLNNGALIELRVTVMPAKAGIQKRLKLLGSRLRGHDC